jgi:regulator of cell morphogenesis and NO signaling
MTTSTAEVSFKQRTVGEIAATVPGATGVFRRYHLDFCCGGDIPLADAAARRRIDYAEIASELEDLDPSEVSDHPRETGPLIDHIVSRYHERHRRELPELIRLALKVEAVHQNHPAVPAGLSDVLKTVRARLETHVQEEEHTLFPAMRDADASLDEQALANLRKEHDEQGVHLHRIESLTDEFQPPDGACRTWHALYTGLARFVDDATEHVHLENNVLFPRFE